MNKTGKWYAYYVSKDSLDWSDSQLKLRLKITGGPNAAPTDAFTNATPGNHRRNLLTRGIVYTRLRIRLDRVHAGQCAVDREMLHPLVETGRRNSHDERVAVPDRCRFEVGSGYAGGRIRTADPRITNALLYRLSYTGKDRAQAAHYPFSWPSCP